MKRSQTRIIPRAIESLTVARIQREGATASEALQYVLKCRRQRRKVRETARSADIPVNTLWRLMNGEGGTTLYNAERIAEALGYRLTLEVLDETLNTFVPDDDSYRMRSGDDSLDAD